MTEPALAEIAEPAAAASAGGREGAVRRLRLERALDLGERAFVVLMFAGLVARMAPAIAARPWNALLLTSEGLVTVFILIRRRPTAVSLRPLDWFAALIGTTAPLLVRPGGHAIAPGNVATALMLFGLGFSIWAKLTLRRSFALAAANRGVVGAGPYAFVRHPMYCAYMINYIGFFLANPLPWNAVFYLIAFVLMIVRILAEERVLAQDPAYAAYMERVRYRLAPGLF
jgi:protein-S-isoprenylcysteine O-methyltransferase Ste14